MGPNRPLSRRSACTVSSQPAPPPVWSAPWRRRRRDPSSTTRTGAWAAATAWWPAPSGCPSSSTRRPCPTSKSVPSALSVWIRESFRRVPRSVRAGPSSSASGRTCWRSPRAASIRPPTSMCTTSTGSTRWEERAGSTSPRSPSSGLGSGRTWGRGPIRSSPGISSRRFPSCSCSGRPSSWGSTRFGRARGRLPRARLEEKGWRPAMNETVQRTVATHSWVTEKLLMGLSPREYVRTLVTPWNIAAALVLVVGLPVIAYRFTYGLGAVTNLSQTNPWGLWIGLDVLCGVALAAGGYTLASSVYLFGLKEFSPVLRPAILTGFLGYFFVVVGLLVDLGQPWRIPYPVIYSYGVTSVMFLVAWHVFLYLTVQFLELCPAILEWLGWKTVRQWATRLTIGATAFGVILST